MTLSARTKGVLCIIAAAMCFSLMSACVRLAGALPTMEKAFFRNFVAAIIVFFLMRARGVPLRLHRGSRRFVLLRCVFGTAGLLLNFYAIDRLALADANMLNKLSPFFAILFSVVLLRERVKPVQALAVAGAFAGALLIIKPTGGNLALLPAVGGFFGGMGAGAAYTCLRRAAREGERSEVIVLCFSCFSCLVTVPFIAAGFVMPSGRQLALLLLCGLCGAGGQFSITAAYSFAPAREISVFDYTQVIFSAILGFFLFGQLPDLFSFIGYALIIAMALINYVYNTRHTTETADAPGPCAADAAPPAKKGE